jgi:hypothetical protein
LEKLADQILLYLRNIKFIGCYEIDPDGRMLAPLLEISTNNPDEVDAGRRVVNSFVDQYKELNDLLQAISDLDDNCYETIYRHDITIHRKKRVDRFQWQVCSGIYAGSDGELVDCARRLNGSRNKAVPYAGAAICLEKNGTKLPKIEGRVSCFLPLSGVLGSSGIGFSINGAFDLDGSRTAITKEREGSFDAASARAEWNELLVTHAIAPALSRVIASIEISDAHSMLLLYSLFPLTDATFMKPFEKLSVCFLRLIADESVFRIADGSCVPLDDVRFIESEPSLQEALCLEEFPIPEPPLPDRLVHSLQVAGLELNDLDAESVYLHFLREEPVECLPHEFEKESLRSEQRVAAIVRFLAQQDWLDFNMLPLAIGLDGYLRTFPPYESPELFIGSDRHHKIFERFPEWFLDPKFVKSSKIRALEADGFTVMELSDVLKKIPEVLFEETSGYSRWDPNGMDSPNTQWLIVVLEELFDNLDYAESEEGERLLKQTPLIPADDNKLHLPGACSTPLLVANTEASFVDLLSTLGVRHFVLRPGHPLTPHLSRFQKEVGLLWSLDPCNLIDSIGDRCNDITADESIWKNEKMVSRLVDFLSKANLEEDEDLREGRENILRALPIWRDTSKVLGPLDDRCYLPGQFTAPLLKCSARIMAGEEQLTLLRKLGVSPIKRCEILSKHYIPDLDVFTQDDLFELAKWLRHEWVHLAEEHVDGEQGLLAKLRDRRILLDEHDRPARPEDLYLSNAAKLAQEVLGKNVRCPSPTRYEDNSELWANFFTRLGVLSSPSSQHLVDFIEQVIRNHDGTLPDAENQRSLIRILGHVREHWQSLYNHKVNTQEFGECFLHEFLAKTSWVPAYREEGAENRFGAWRQPEARLFQPKELVPFSVAARAASVLPVAPNTKHEFSSQARTLLDVVNLPPAVVVCTHLRNVAARFGNQPLAPEAYERMSKVLHEIFRGLAALETKADEDDDGSLISNLHDACAKLRDVACLPDTTLRCLRVPRDVYRSDAIGMSPIKATLKGKTDDIERGMKLLGRLEQPGIDDIADAMVRLRDRGTPLSEDEFKAVLACLRRLVTLYDVSPPAERVLVPLPNSERIICDPDKLLWVNDRYLGDQLHIEVGMRLHEEVPDRLLSYVSIPTLSQAEASVQGELINSGNTILNIRCKEIENLLRSPQFLDGLARVLKTECRQLTKVNVMWLSSTQVTAHCDVECAYNVRMPSGKTISLGSAKTAIAYGQVGEGGQFFVAESALKNSLLESHFARELRRQLDSEAPKSDNGSSAIRDMLMQSPESLEQTLDSLGFLSLSPAITETEVDDSTASSHYFGEEAWDADTAELSEMAVIDDSTQAHEDPQDDSRLSYEDDSKAEGLSLPHGRPRNTGWPSSSGKSDGKGYRPQGMGKGKIPPSKEKISRPARMTQGGESTHTEQNRVSKAVRQQDGFWISRPKTEQQAREEREKEDTHYDEDEDGRSLNVGKLAVGWVLQYEHSQQREAISMAHANPGYDVESRSGLMVERYIEVKGIDGAWGQNGVPMSSIQFFRATKPENPVNGNSSPMGDKFWLYVVEHVSDPAKVKIHMIQNPAARATQFRFDCGWRNAGKTAEGFSPLIPRRGMKIRKILDEGVYVEGEITRVDDNNYLVVRFANQIGSTIVYDPTRHLLLE